MNLFRIVSNEVLAADFARVLHFHLQLTAVLNCHKFPNHCCPGIFWLSLRTNAFESNSQSSLGLLS